MPDNYITLSQLTKTTKGLVNKINAESTVTNSKIGDLANLNTTAKTDLVAAINEAAASGTQYDDTALAGRVTALENAGYITSYTETDPTVPSWAKQANKPTYTAAEVGALPDTYTAPVTSVNEETGNVIISKIKTTAPSNNVEYNLMGTTSNNNTVAVSPYNQDLLSFAKTTDFSRLTIGSTATPGKVRLYSSADSASGYTELKSNASSTNAREVVFPDASGTVALTTDLNSYVKGHVNDSSTSGVIQNLPGNVYLSAITSRTNSSKIDLNGSTIKIKSWSGISEPSTSIITLTPTTTTIKNVVTPTENGDAVNKEYVDGLVSGMLHYKGTKATISALPSSGNTTGDVWHITADGSEWAWDGSEWQELGTTIDLSGYVPSSRTINGKALTSNISLDANDVSALPASTTYVSTFNGQSGAITYTAPVTSVNGRTGAVTVTEYDDTALAARVTALEQIPWVTYYTGSSTPSNSQGNNGDLYFQTAQ